MEPLRQPVVLVEIDGDSVTLNGALVDRIDDADSWIVGIQAVCSTVSIPLGRPVWAEVSEPGGTTRLAVHPDGSISHVQQLDLPFEVPGEVDAELDAEDDLAEAAAPLVLVPEPEVATVPVVQADLPEIPEVPAPHDELAAFLARSARAQEVHVPRPRTPYVPRAPHTSHAPRSPLPAHAPHPPHSQHPPHSERHRGAPRPHPVVHRTTPVLGVAALVTVAVLAALLVTRGDDTPQAATEPTSQTQLVKDVLPAASRVQLRDRFPRNLDVHVTPHAASVEVRVEASRLPVRAMIVLRSAGGERVEREVMLRQAVTQVRLGAVAPGSVDWVVRVAGAETETGSVTIPEPPTETTTAPEPEPSEPHSPAEPTPSEPSEPLTPIDPDEDPTGPVDPDEPIEGQ